ncbi:MAG: hypothetical protein HEEMFOPI_00212 [Holosporales bacterium]
MALKKLILTSFILASSLFSSSPDITAEGIPNNQFIEYTVVVKNEESPDINWPHLDMLKSEGPNNVEPSEESAPKSPIGKILEYLFSKYLFNLLPVEFFTGSIFFKK